MNQKCREREWVAASLAPVLTHIVVVWDIHTHEEKTHEVSTTVWTKSCCFWICWHTELLYAAAWMVLNAIYGQTDISITITNKIDSSLIDAFLLSWPRCNKTNVSLFLRVIRTWGYLLTIPNGQESYPEDLRIIQRTWKIILQAFESDSSNRRLHPPY